jgi:hypothetical protein
MQTKCASATEAIINTIFGCAIGYGIVYAVLLVDQNPASAAACSVALNVPASAVRKFVIRRIFESMTLVEERPRDPSGASSDSDHRRTRNGKGKGESPYAPNFDSERLPEPVKVSLPVIDPSRHAAAFRAAMDEAEQVENFGEWK